METFRGAVEYECECNFNKWLYNLSASNIIFSKTSGITNHLSLEDV